eukprot:scaffold90839_cov39-Phaeocystis_antarctica.AAC.2
MQESVSVVSRSWFVRQIADGVYLENGTAKRERIQVRCSYLPFSPIFRLFFLVGRLPPSSWPNAPAPDHCGAPAPVAVSSSHLPSLMLTTLPVRRTWAFHRLCFRTGCRKA